MANALYPKWKEAVLQAAANSSLTGTVKVMLVDLADYTYSASHQFLSDVPAAARVATQTVANKTFVNGVFDHDDVVFNAVSGDTSEALVWYIDTGVEGTSRLVYFADTGQIGLPITPNGANLNLTIDNGASKVFAL